MNPPPLDIRPVGGDADLETWLTLHNAVRSARALSAEETRAYWDACPAHVALLALAGGDPAAAGAAVLAPTREPSTADVEVAVPREHRRRGVGSALLAALTGWASGQRRTHVEVEVDEADEESRGWAERRGFVEVGRESLLVLDLMTAGPARAEPPPGIEIVTWAERPEVAPGLYEVACEAYPDIPGNEDEVMEPYEEWLAHDMGGPSDRPEATFVALARDEVVGYAKLHLPHARPGVAAHDLTAVKRAWRGHGVARALKAAQIAWATRAGYERLETLNEARNEPIRRLNERFGYRLAPGRVFLRARVPLNARAGPSSGPGP